MMIAEARMLASYDMINIHNYILMIISDNDAPNTFNNI